MSRALPTLMDTQATAQLLGVQPRTLEAWRTRGHGPPFVTLSPRCVRYRLEEVERWLNNRTAESTSQRTQNADEGPQ